MRDQDQRSAIGGQEPKFNFPVSQIDTVARGLTDYALVDLKTGQVWSSAPDARTVRLALTDAVDKFQTEPTGSGR